MYMCVILGGNPSPFPPLCSHSLPDAPILSPVLPLHSPLPSGPFVFLSDKSSSPNMKMEALAFLNVLFVHHGRAVFYPHIPDITPVSSTHAHTLSRMRIRTHTRTRACTRAQMHSCMHNDSGIVGVGKSL